MRDVACLIRSSFESIVAWTQTYQTDSLLEALNGLLQAAKRQARSRIGFEKMRAVLLRIAVGFDFARINPHAADPLRPPAARVQLHTGASERRHPVPPGGQERPRSTGGYKFTPLRRLERPKPRKV
ncbi:MULTISPECIES: hypothetical protein [Pseudomonadaceae]|uniref:hypothetical protein n=1 Tax=Pseudomonadaceae TaxID=135621 RepID=UPI002A4317AD|nr:hypothetical protein [Gammaproteobacteria bacterium]